MFIQTMTSNELWKEYNADLPELNAYGARIDNSEYVSKLLQKNKKSGNLSFVKFFNTARGNRYINVFKYTKLQNRAWDWIVLSVGLMNTPKGICAIMFSDDRRMALTFQAHFFMRYKSRMLEVCDWKLRNNLNAAKSLEDIIAIYIRRNQDAAIAKTGSKYGNKEHLFAPVNDGVVLFQDNGKTIQANTFITEDMLSLKQKELMDNAVKSKETIEKATELLRLLAEKCDK